MSASIEIEGEDGIGSAIEASINRAIGGLDGAVASIVAGGRRGQGTNTLIAKVQTGQMRDPFYLDAQARQAIRFALNGLTAGNYSTRMRALVLAGELMLNAIARNVERQQNADGQSFKDLTAKYAAAKRRKFGFVTPILRATGDLLGNLKARVDGLS